MTLYREATRDEIAIDDLGVASAVDVYTMDVVSVERAPRFQDQPNWPIRWCPEHCCGSVDTFPERNASTGYKERCYRGWEFDEDCTLLVVEVILIGEDSTP